MHWIPLEWGGFSGAPESMVYVACEWGHGGGCFSTWETERAGEGCQPNPEEGGCLGYAQSWTWCLEHPCVFPMKRIFMRERDRQTDRHSHMQMEPPEAAWDTWRTRAQQGRLQLQAALDSWGREGSPNQQERHEATKVEGTPGERTTTVEMERGHVLDSWRPKNRQSAYNHKQAKGVGVPVARGAVEMNPARIHEDLGSIPGLAQGLRIRCCRELWCRSHVRLHYWVAVAVV